MKIVSTRNARERRLIASYLGMYMLQFSTIQWSRRTFQSNLRLFIPRLQSHLVFPYRVHNRNAFNPNAFFSLAQPKTNPNAPEVSLKQFRPIYKLYPLVGRMVYPPPVPTQPLSPLTPSLSCPSGQEDSLI